MPRIIEPSRLGRGLSKPSSNLFPKNAWTDITPPGLNLQPHDFTASYGIPWVEVWPTDNNLIYACADQKGLWKSTNGGINWVLVGGTTTPSNSGTTTTYFDSPICVRVDPADQNHILVSQGVRGSTQGFWVSTDGVNFTQPAGFLTQATALGTRDCTLLATDPGNFNNLLLSSHQGWPSLSNNGFLSSTDCGATWVQCQPNAAWAGGSLGLTFLHDIPSGQGNSITWLVGSDGQGLWRTIDSGATYTKVSTQGPIHGGHVCFYDSTGRLWAGAGGAGPLYSNDNGVTWTQSTTGLVNVGSYYNVVSDGTTLYASPSYTGDNSTLTPEPFFTSLVSNGTSWASFNGGAQLFSCGPFVMRYAPQLGRIYAACWGAGLKVLQL